MVPGTFLTCTRYLVTINNCVRSPAYSTCVGLLNSGMRDTSTASSPSTRNSKQRLPAGGGLTAIALLIVPVPMPVVLSMLCCNIDTVVCGMTGML